MRNNFIPIKRILTGAVFCSLFSVTCLRAQVTVETESVTDKYYVEIDSRSGFSGGQGIAMQACYGSAATYTINVAEAGTYDLALDYVTMNERFIYIKVNNQIHSVVHFDDLTTTWDGSNGTVKTKTVQIYLEAGDNYLTLGGYEGLSPTDGLIGFAPPLDKFTITRASTEIAKPGTQITKITIEGEDADVKTGNFGSVSQPQFSGGLAIGGNSGYAQYSNVAVAEEGTYDLAMFYTTMNERSLTVKVNKQVATTVAFKDKTDSWGDQPGTATKPAVFRKTIQIYLKAGVNVIQLGSAGDWAPNIDKFEIQKAGVSITEPELEYAAYVSDFTDKISAVTEQNVTTSENLKKLFDNKETSVYTVNGVNSTQIAVKLAYPILLTYYSLYSTEAGSVDVATWTVESSADSLTWTAVPLSGTVTDNGGFKTFKTTLTNASTTAARYFRLTATGSGKVEIGEWQLHGLPYVSASQPFPDDLINKGTTGTLAAKTGYSGEDYPNAIDKTLTKKYTLVNDKALYLQYKFNTATVVNRYEIAMPWSQPNRHIKTWTLQASNDGTSWTTLDTRRNIAFPGFNTTLSFNVVNQTAYIYYKLNATENTGDVSTQVLQWQLYNDDIMVNSLDLSATSIEIVKGNSELITASLLPIDATNKNLIWTVESESVPGVISVANGTINGLLEGTAVVRITSASNPLVFAFVNVTVKGTVGIEIGKSVAITIYPNPVTDQLNVISASVVKAIQVFDAKGQLIHTQHGSNPVPATSWNAGVYLLKVTTDAGTSIHKIVKK
ncbi:MAG: T9SS type A sorting domain-containing protein [Dysgonomonas sp.]